MRIVVEIESEKDANLLISLVKRLKGKILEEGISLFTSKKGKTINPVASLEAISQKGWNKFNPRSFRVAKKRKERQSNTRKVDMKILLDSNIIIYATKPGYAALRKKLNESSDSYCVSTITMLEVLGYHLLNQPDKAELEEFFSSVPLLLVDDLVIQRGIQLRQKLKMSLGDCIIASTALIHDLELWTNNIADFENVEGIKLLNPLALK